jgi:WD40 repeat protein
MSDVDTPCDIFLSYARADRAVAEAIRTELSFAGRAADSGPWSVFFDTHHIRGGEAWHRRIVDAIGRCAAFVAVLTPDFLGSKMCMKEWGWLMTRESERTERLSLAFTLRVKDCQPPSDIAAVQWRDLRGVSIDSVDFVKTVGELAADIAPNVLAARRMNAATPGVAGGRHADSSRRTSPEAVGGPAANIDTQAGLSSADQVLVDKLAECVRRDDDVVARRTLSILTSRLGVDAPTVLEWHEIVDGLFGSEGVVPPASPSGSPGPEASPLDAPSVLHGLGQQQPAPPLEAPSRAHDLVHDAQVSAAEFVPYAPNLIATTSYDGMLRIWRTDEMGRAALSASILAHPEHRIETLAVAPEGRRLLTAGWDRCAKLWERSDEEGRDGLHELTQLPVHGSVVESAAFSHDGRMLLAGTRNRTAGLWSLTDGVPDRMTELPGHSDWVRAVAFSPDDQWALTCAWQHAAMLWALDRRTRSARLVRTLSGHTGAVMALAFSPDGRWALTGSWDATARLWRIGRDGRAEATARLRGHDKPVASVEFAPGGDWAITASWDGTARLWRLDGHGNAACVRLLTGHSSWITSARFSHDGRLVVTASADNTAKLWRLGDVIGYSDQRRR